MSTLNVDQNDVTSPRLKESSRKRRRKKLPKNNDDVENIVDTDVTMLNSLSAASPRDTSEQRERYAERRLMKMSNTSDDGENVEQTRRRRKVRSARKAAGSQSREVLELKDRNKQSINDDVDGNPENRDNESGRKVCGHRENRSEKRRHEIGTYNYENYNGDEVFHTKYNLDLDDILEPADLNHSSTRFIGGHVMPQLRSQQTDIVYIEKKGGQGFANEDKNKIIKMSTKTSDQIVSVQKSALHFVLKIQLGFRTFSLMIHGLLAGLALSQLLFVYALSKNDDKNLLEMYHELALPYQCMYYFLLAICNVSIFDRYVNISSGWRHFLSILLRKPSRAFALIFYVFALILSAGLAQLDNRISMYSCMPHLWTNNVNKHIALWKIVNLLRVVGSVLGWIMVCLAPNFDETTASIEKKMRKEEHDKMSASNGRTSVLQNSTSVVTWDVQT